jgi:hypothetical protein
MKHFLVMSVIILGLTVSAQANVKDIDFTKREENLTSNRFTIKKEKKIIFKDHFTQQRFETKKLQKFYTSLLKKNSSFPLNEKHKKQFIKTKKLKFPFLKNKKEIASQNRKLIHFRSIQKKQQSQYNRSHAMTLHDLGNYTYKLANSLDTMSLQDMNRNFFSRNRSSSPGIPVENVGQDKNIKK